MRPIKVGVIGCGYWGPNLIRNFSEISGSALQMVCDLDNARLEHIQSRYPSVRVCRSYRDLLKTDVEAVAIATPVSSHHRIALDCLRAGKHVLIEKPLASKSAEAEAIIQAGEKAGRVVMVGHTFVYNPAVVALKEIIASGEIGQVYYFNCT
jgi:predicted dehydrogenase